MMMFIFINFLKLNQLTNVYCYRQMGPYRPETPSFLTNPFPRNRPSDRDGFGKVPLNSTFRESENPVVH